MDRNGTFSKCPVSVWECTASVVISDSFSSSVRLDEISTSSDLPSFGEVSTFDDLASKSWSSTVLPAATVTF